MLNLCGALLLTVLPYLVSSLSYPVCDKIGEEYTTDSSRLTGDAPFYNLLFTCSGDLNLEGYAVDACVNNGKTCGQAAADAFCQYLGFDKNAPGLYSTITADTPTLSMTGEWCMTPGMYQDLGRPNRTEFDTIKTQNQGPYCAALDSVACIRSRNTLANALPKIRTTAAESPATAPSPSTTPGSAFLIANPISTAGRRMKGMSIPTA